MDIIDSDNINQDIESNSDSKRKLASIQVVDKIERHADADSLDIATILGWQTITKIGEVILGERVIYCEIDSMLPYKAEWLPIAVKDRIAKENVAAPFRIRTIKLRGKVSQGLIIPLNNFLPLYLRSLEVGHDVTSILGITKYDPPPLSENCALFQSRRAGSFPSRLLNKTDERRIQSYPDLLTDLNGKPYNITVKMDGTSVTYLIDPQSQNFLVCSRNMVRERPINPSLCPYWCMAVKYDIEAKLKLIPHIAIQGEICGPNIQKNLAKLDSFELFVYNLIDINEKRRLPLYTMLSLCSSTLELQTVPLEERGPAFGYTNIKQLLDKAKGRYLGTKNAREGLVIRSIDQTISFKVINNEYLLKHG